MKAPVEPHGFNLATRTPAERLAVDADRIACYLRKVRQGLSMADWRKLRQETFDAMPEERRLMVDAALKARAKS